MKQIKISPNYYVQLNVVIITFRTLQDATKICKAEAERLQKEHNYYTLILE
jgi:hypothetical protein